MNKETEKMAEAHADWFLKIIRPIMISSFIHGFKHGAKDSDEEPIVLSDMEAQ